MSGVRFSVFPKEPHTYVKNGTTYRVGNYVNWKKRPNYERLMGEIISIEDTGNPEIKKIAINALVMQDEKGRNTIDSICGFKPRKRKAKVKKQYKIVEINTNILF